MNLVCGRDGYLPSNAISILDLDNTLSSVASSLGSRSSNLARFGGAHLSSQHWEAKARDCLSPGG